MRNQMNLLQNDTSPYNEESLNVLNLRLNDEKRKVQQESIKLLSHLRIVLIAMFVSQLGKQVVA